jgi:hypothetical protein
MRAILILYLYNQPFEKKEIELSGNDPELTWEVNMKIRENELQAQVEIMRLQYTRQILKVGWNNYCMAVVFESKIYMYESEPDFN